MTIWCQGSLQAEAYSLFIDPESQALDTRIPQDSSKKTGFVIERMSSTTARRYQCAYYTRKNSWSERSDPLSLVVTGMYDAPSLSARPSPVVASGGYVSLSCSSQIGWGTFHLLKDGRADSPIHMDSRISYARWPTQAQALFPVGPVNTSHGGTYRCYGSSSSNPNVWSHPSNPLHLMVTGAADIREPPKNTSGTKTASDTQEYTVGNLTRMGVAGFILLVLGMLLFEAWHSQRRTHRAARTGTQRQPTIKDTEPVS